MSEDLQRREKIKERIANHIKEKKKWEMPNWILYTIGVVGLIFFLYGLVQQFRVWRWSGLLGKSKKVIEQLMDEKQQIAYQVTKKFSEQGVKEAKKDLNRLEKKQKKLKKKQDQIKEDVQKLDPVGILEEFGKEGF